MTTMTDVDGTLNYSIALSVIVILISVVLNKKQ